MKDTKQGTDTSGVEEGLKSLVNAQWLVGKELLRLFTDVGGTALQGVGGMRRPGAEGCCSVPEPCWMPLSLGELHCQIKPGDSASVCLVVTNGDFRPHDVQFVASGRSAALVSFSQASAVLGPKERIAVSATLTVPRDGKPAADCRGIDHEVLLWVRGCRNHYLRLSIDEVAQCKPCCHEVAVNDDPDYVLHWYDHFYLPRPCFGAVAPAAAVTAVGGLR